jgi:hypothetical protein
MIKEDCQLLTFWEEGLKIQDFSLKTIRMIIMTVHEINLIFKIIDQISYLEGKLLKIMEGLYQCRVGKIRIIKKLNL